MAWPNYQPVSLRSVSLRELSVNIHLFKTMRISILLILLLAAYLFGTHLSFLPFIHYKVLHSSIARVAFLTIIDQLFTGGSLGVFSPFALGVFPLLLFRSWTAALTGGRVSRHGSFNILISVIFVFGVVLVILWLCLSNIVPATFINVALTFFYLIGGSILLFFINYQLTKYKGPTIISINAIIIAYAYARILLSSSKGGDLLVFAFILLFVGSFILLVKYVKYVPLVNVRDAAVQRGQLPIPATNGSMRFALLITTFIILTAITTLLNFFFGNTLSPFGDSLLDVLLFIAILIIISIALISSEMIDNVLSQFNGTATAHTLMTNYWLVSDPPLPIGKATAHHLSHEALKSHRLNYIFYLVWAVLFSLIGFFAQVFQLPLHPLPFGPIGLVILLTLCSELSYTLFVALYHFVQSIRFGELWVSSNSALSNLQIFTESYELDEIIEQILPLATDEERERLNYILLSLREGKVRFIYIKEMLQIFNQISKRMVDNSIGTMFFHLILLFFACIFLSLVITICAVLLVQLFVEHTAFSDMGIRITEVLGLPLAFLAWMPIIGLDKSIRDVFLALRARRGRLPQGMSMNVPLKTYEPERAELAYQVLLRQQYDLINEKRRFLLLGENVHVRVLDMLRMTVDRKVDAVLSDTLATNEQVEHLIDELDKWHLLPEMLTEALGEIREREAIRKVLHTCSVSFYEKQGAQFDEQLALLKEKFNIQDLSFEEGIPLLSNIATLSITLLPFRSMEQVLWLNLLDFFWGRHADRLNAARMRMLSSLSIQKEDLDHFEWQADNEFEQLQLDIQLNTVHTLLVIFHVALSSLFPQINERNVSNIDETLLQNAVNVQQASLTMSTPEVPETSKMGSHTHEGPLSEENE